MGHGNQDMEYIRWLMFNQLKKLNQKKVEGGEK